VSPAAAEFGAELVLKACSRDIPHKSDHGLVALDVEDVRAEFRRQRGRVRSLGAPFEGVIAARRVPKGMELALGARSSRSFELRRCAVRSAVAHRAMWKAFLLWR